MKHPRHHKRQVEHVVATVRTASFHHAEIVLAVLLVFTVLGVALAVTRARIWDLLAAALLLVTSAAWLLVDHPIEGAVLLTVSANHGLTSGDLLALPASALAVALILRWCAVRLQRPSAAAPEAPDAPSNA